MTKLPEPKNEDMLPEEVPVKYVNPRIDVNALSDESEINFEDIDVEVGE